MSNDGNAPGDVIKERSAKATRDLCTALELGVLPPAKLKYLTIALTEVATEVASQSADFARRVRSAYESVLPAKPDRRRTPHSPRKSWKVELTPIATVDETLLNPYAPPNPFALQRLYGNDQLPLALDRYSLTKLKEAVMVVQEQYPNTKPKRMTKPNIIQYIVETLTSVNASL